MWVITHRRHCEYSWNIPRTQRRIVNGFVRDVLQKLIGISLEGSVGVCHAKPAGSLFPLVLCERKPVKTENVRTDARDSERTATAGQRGLRRVRYLGAFFTP
jgi:hypothetical protein